MHNVTRYILFVTKVTLSVLTSQYYRETIMCMVGASHNSHVYIPEANAQYITLH